MIKEYPNGEEFIKDNVKLLDANKYMSALFYFDAPLLNEINNKDYALRAYNDDKSLVALKVSHYNLMLLGDKECLPELLKHIVKKELALEGVLCPTDIGDYLIQISSDLLHRKYHKQIGMDFMEAKDYIVPTSDDVIIPSPEDLDEIVKYSYNFMSDCGLPDIPNVTKIKETLPNYRIIKVDNEIASMAKFGPNTENSMRISYVYTHPKYRGRGLAKKVVNAIKNEILSRNMIPTLNVDQANPISNHVYNSLGFKKVFSQGIYLPEK